MYKQKSCFILHAIAEALCFHSNRLLCYDDIFKHFVALSVCKTCQISQKIVNTNLEEVFLREYSLPILDSDLKCGERGGRLYLVFSGKCPRRHLKCTMTAS